MKLSGKNRFERRMLVELGDPTYLSCKVRPVTGAGAEVVVLLKTIEKKKEKRCTIECRNCRGWRKRGDGGSGNVGRQVLEGRCGRDCRCKRWRGRKEKERAQARP